MPIWQVINHYYNLLLNITLPKALLANGLINTRKNAFIPLTQYLINISPNCYYNYKKDAKRKYHKRLADIFERIKYVYYNNNRVIGY